MPIQRSPATAEAGWNFDNSYARLPAMFYSPVNPVPATTPGIAIFNHALAKSMGLDGLLLDSPAGAAIFSGNMLPQGAEPIAQAYAGHQFGRFTMLGDGRAILLGEQLAPSGARWDVQLKGSGRTPYSRGGDGRAALGPMLREYIISEAMHALGVPTTRSLAVTTTGESVQRDRALPGAILTRVAASHIRVGTFVYASLREEIEPLQILADYMIQRHFPECSHASSPYRALLEAVIEHQALLAAKWMNIAFIHGVMNTDNMALSGETIDYGPCAFMDAYDTATVFSSIDQQGRYAYGNQPNIAHWNLARLAEAMLPLFDKDENKAVDTAHEALAIFPNRFKHHWLAGMRAKLGLFGEEDDDVALIDSLLRWMQKNGADFTNTFRDLDPINLINNGGDTAFKSWHGEWLARLARQKVSTAQVKNLMQANNPAVIPRNHRVEEALEAAVERGDYSSMRRLLTVLAKPFERSQEALEYGTPAPHSSAPYRTFCGT